MRHYLKNLRNIAGTIVYRADSRSVRGWMDKMDVEQCRTWCTHGEIVLRYVAGIVQIVGLTRLHLGTCCAMMLHVSRKAGQIRQQ